MTDPEDRHHLLNQATENARAMWQQLEHFYTTSEDDATRIYDLVSSFEYQLDTLICELDEG